MVDKSLKRCKWDLSQMQDIELTTVAMAYGADCSMEEFPLNEDTRTSLKKFVSQNISL